MGQSGGQREAETGGLARNMRPFVWWRHGRKVEAEAEVKRQAPGVKLCIRRAARQVEPGRTVRAMWHGLSDAIAEMKGMKGGAW
eukprot:48917-Chlamydomonas_euryale.AAC.1